jgi:hypothetical protein
MNINSSFHQIARRIVSVVSQWTVVFGLFSMVMMPIGSNSTSDSPIVDPVAAVPAIQPAISSYAWIQALPVRERFLAEKLTRLEQLQGTLDASAAGIPAECSYQADHQEIAALAAQTGVSRLTVLKAQQANCFAYTGYR